MAPLGPRMIATALSSTACPVTRPNSAEIDSGMAPRKSRVRYSGWHPRSTSAPPPASSGSKKRAGSQRRPTAPSCDSRTADLGDLAQATGPEDVADRERVSVRQPRQRDDELDRPSLDRVDDLARLGRRQRQHLLGEDVLAGLGGRDDHVAVRGRPRGDDDAVDVGPGQQLCQVRVERDAEVRCGRRAAGRILVPGRHDLDVRMGLRLGLRSRRHGRARSPASRRASHG